MAPYPSFLKLIHTYTHLSPIKFKADNSINKHASLNSIYLSIFENLCPTFLLNSLQGVSKEHQDINGIYILVFFLQDTINWTIKLECIYLTIRWNEMNYTINWNMYSKTYFKIQKGLQLRERHFSKERLCVLYVGYRRF